MNTSEKPPGATPETGVSSLKKKSLWGFAWFIVSMAILLFVPAGTIHFWQAWIYFAVVTAASVLIWLYLWKHDPQLLDRRQGGPAAEKTGHQKWIRLLMIAAFISSLIVPSLDRRLAWSNVPVALVIVGDALVALAYYVMFLAFRANTFAAAVVEVAAGQSVVSTGPYAVVRHPIYSGAVVMFIGAPAALASWWGFVPSLLMTLMCIWRLLEEETFLSAHLPGYSDYRRKVRYRLLPFVF